MVMMPGEITSIEGNFVKGYFINSLEKTSCYAIPCTK